VAISLHPRLVAQPFGFFVQWFHSVLFRLLASVAHSLLWVPYVRPVSLALPPYQSPMDQYSNPHASASRRCQFFSVRTLSLSSSFATTAEI
jgi:hypothetical protein